jgi:hypothetical protein
MKHFQIKLVDKLGHGSFLYFDATDETAQDIACDTANEYIKQQRYKSETLSHSPFHTPFKPFKTISVVEYDTVNHGTKRGGLKFKLTLDYIKVKFIDGSTFYNNWYTPQ